jgi:formamidopyrimidine-DNA glycosylase
MPELPEVETTVNDLKPFVIGRKIKRVAVLSEGTIAVPSAEEFADGLKGRKVVDITRRGKHLIFKLDNGKFWIVHMRMTGSLMMKPADEDPVPSIRVIIYLDNEQAIHFRDVRRFGKMWLVDDANDVVGRLGPEPLEPGFTAQALGKILDGHSTNIKSFLLDQTRIAGIGNMYADEALYAARLHPLRPANSLTKTEIKRLHEAIQGVLSQGIRNKGASTDTYIRPEGIKGQAQLQFQVAHQKGKDCPVCGGPIERIEVGQRGTFFCPKCQKLVKSSKAKA